MRHGFSLIELLVVIAVLAILAALLAPAARNGLASARNAVCVSNLRQMQLAYSQYLDDHDGQFFPWRENLPDGILWYWGLETSGPTRPLDRNRGRLAPYLLRSRIELCPAFPYDSPLYMQKFESRTYGYGINVFLLSDSPESRSAGVQNAKRVTRPADTLAWGDAIQINTFQAPASPKNPMLEEWYYLAARAAEKPTAHFRHLGRMNAVMLDGSVRSMAPLSLRPECDGRVGQLADPANPVLLKTVK